MFTGIVETLGIISDIKKDQENIHLTIQTNITNEEYLGCIYFLPDWISLYFSFSQNRVESRFHIRPRSHILGFLLHPH